MRRSKTEYTGMAGTNLLRFLRKSRGIRNLLTRAGTLFKRFGFSPTNMEGALNEWAQTIRKHGFRTSLPVTAIIVKRYPGAIKRLQGKGLEFALHGHTHIDHALLSLGEQTESFKEAIRIFKSNAIAFDGFRAPYTRWNEATMKALRGLKLKWDSSKTIIWDELNGQMSSDGNEHVGTKRNWAAYDRILRLYEPRKASTCPVVPEFSVDGDSDSEKFVEIPLCLPDDEMLLDRLGLSPEEVGRVWKSVLRQSYTRGELFTLQLHPERFPLCKLAVEETIRKARRYDPQVWVASLSEIAKWWEERADARMEIEEKGQGRYKVSLDGAARFTILLRNVEIETGRGSDFRTESWYGSYQRVVEDKDRSASRDSRGTREFWLRSSSYPGIGVADDCSAGVKNFLGAEGYLLGKERDCELSFDGREDPGKTEILARIEGSSSPICRLWRWPNGARSCLSITGDVDALTLIDFFMRAFGK